jgi:hypothetical protein
VAFPNTSERRTGVHVIGYWQLRAEPDYADVSFAVSTLESEPQGAFDEVRKGIREVNRVLGAAGIDGHDVQMSRVTLQQETDFTGGKRVLRGYRAKAVFAVRLANLDGLEALLVSVVKAGANEISGVTFRTRRLRELRAEARTRAVTVAKAKAEAFCEAAGVKLGPVVYLEDGNALARSVDDERAHYAAPPTEDESGDRGLIAPGTITVAVTVTMAFGIA